MTDGYVMLVPETTDSFLANIGALWSLGEGEVVSHLFTPEDRCVSLLLKNLGKRMPKDETREELEAQHIDVHAFMQLPLRPRKQDAADRLSAPQFIASAELSLAVTKVRSVTDFCRLIV
jgi:hypothetical protein